MTKAAKGDTVKVHYRGTLEDGSEFDSSHDRDPLTVTVGGGEVIPGFDQALEGMAPGDSKTVTVESGDAYGEHRPEMVQKIERARIPGEIELQVGGVLQATAPDGQVVRLTVTEFDDETVTLDANHPLAGKDLTFDLQLVEIV
jgi:peptidylprolyl isomerase